MPQARKLDQTTLLALAAEGLTAVNIQRRLADRGSWSASTWFACDCRRRGGMPGGEPPAPQPQRKSSATNWRQGQLTEAINLVEALKEDLEGVLEGWGDSFAGSERYERFAVAVGELESIAKALGGVDVS